MVATGSRDDAIFGDFAHQKISERAPGLKRSGVLQQLQLYGDAIVERNVQALRRLGVEGWRKLLL